MPTLNINSYYYSQFELYRDINVLRIKYNLTKKPCMKIDIRSGYTLPTSPM